MKEIVDKTSAYMQEMIEGFGFDLNVAVEWDDSEGCRVEFSGEDTEFVLSENGEMLDAFETLLFQMFGREIEREHRFVCDAEGFRTTRMAELAVMAKFAAKNVREKGTPFKFGDLNSTERRMIHLTLKEEEDLLTESVGNGRDRRLQVSLR